MPDPTLLISDDAMLEHDPGHGHPERPGRLRAVLQSLRESPIEGVRWATPRPATFTQLTRAHHPQYVEMVELTRGHPEHFDADTWSSPGTVRAAELSAGGAIDAVEAVLAGKDGCRRAFSLGRPPGHHAEAHRAMGFCFFCNAAIAALHAIGEHGLERVLILDWDVHHANGTQHILDARREVLLVSLHQFPFYPGTGALTEHGHAKGEGYTVNVPMPAGCADGEYLALLDRVVIPIADAYAPQLVIVSAGFDAHASDPLAAMDVSTEGFRAMCARVRALADRQCDGRLVLLLEGGYDLGALASSVRACVEDLTGARRADPEQAPGESARAAQLVAQIRAAQAPFWGDALGAS